MKILTQNIKLKKNPVYNTWGLDLAPHKLSGYNVCQFAGVCSQVCVGEHSGMNKMPVAKQAKINRTKRFFEDRANFLADVHYDLDKINNSKDPRQACVRLNVDSDLPWEIIDPTLFQYKNIIFYDYCKSIKRALDYVNGNMPKNYHLTYSWNEKSDVRKVNKLLSSGGRINMVLDIPYRADNLIPVPKTVNIGTKTWKVIDGDLTDERIPQNDGKSKVVVVRAKFKKSRIQEFVDKKFFVPVINGIVKR
jgi:hypothetical protein